MASKSQASSKADNKTQVLKSGNSEETSLKSVPVPANKEEDDPELNALLDSALEDFDNQPKHSQPLSADLSKADDALQGKKEPSGSVPAAELSEQQETLFNELFGSESSEDGGGNKEFEETMKRFMQQDPDMLSQFQKISQLAGNPEGGDREGREQEFADTLAQTLSGLAQNAQGLQDQMSEDDLIRALGGLGMGGESGDGPEADIMPMMQGMMKNLLSKDVLYPSLKEISEKYPKWLEGNKDKTEAAEYENYQKQYHLMDHICQQFEAEDPKEPENVKNERFEKILDLMQQMQELGHPPKEIVGEMAPGLEFDENGLPKFGGSQQCSVM